MQRKKHKIKLLPSMLRNKKIFKNSLLVTFAFSFFVAQNVFAATPTISNVTGTVANGNTLTIAGSNMVQDIVGKFTPTAGGFEGANLAADGWGECLNSTKNCAYDSSVKLLGGKSFRSDMINFNGIGGPENNSSGDSTYRYLGGKYNRMYVKYSSNFNTVWQNGNYVKMILTSAGGGYGQTYISPEPRTGLTGPTEMYVTADYTQQSEIYPTLPSPWIPNRWFCVEWYSNPGIGVTVWVDGIFVGTSNGNSSDPVNQWTQVGIINAHGIGTDFLGTFSMWMDGVMSSDNMIYPASTIEISNNATYGQGTKKYQEPVFLSDGSVQIKADLTSLGAGPYYLWVTNNQQQRVAVPYNLSSSTTYSISNFTTLISSWLHLSTGNASDLNFDNIANTKDLGIMMSKWN